MTKQDTRPGRRGSCSARHGAAVSVSRATVRAALWREVLWGSAAGLDGRKRQKRLRAHKSHYLGKRLLPQQSVVNGNREKGTGTNKIAKEGAEPDNW